MGVRLSVQIDQLFAPQRPSLGRYRHGGGYAAFLTASCFSFSPLLLSGAAIDAVVSEPAATLLTTDDVNVIFRPVRRMLNARTQNQKV